MPIYDSKEIPLMERLQAANDKEGITTKDLLAYMQSGGNDDARLMELTDAMTSAHEEKMQIYEELQQFRLDR